MLAFLITGGVGEREPSHPPGCSWLVGRGFQLVVGACLEPANGLGKMEIPELQTTVIEMKSSMNGLNKRLKMSGGRVSILKTDE